MAQRVQNRVDDGSVTKVQRHGRGLVCKQSITTNARQTNTDLHTRPSFVHTSGERCAQLDYDGACNVKHGTFVDGGTLPAPSSARTFQSKHLSITTKKISTTAGQASELYFFWRTEVWRPRKTFAAKLENGDEVHVKLQNGGG